MKKIIFALFVVLFGCSKDKTLTVEEQLQKDIATMKQLLDSAIVQKMLDSTEASRLVREGLVLAQKNNDVHWISQCYSALAIIQEANGRHEKAQIYYFEEYNSTIV